MKLKFIGSFMIIIVAIALVSACSQEPEPEPVPVTSAVQQPPVVSAEAFVVPLQEADLAFEVGGKVASVAVEEGEEVEEGQLLAELENSAQRAALAQAEAAVAQAEAQLAEAAARLAEAQANLAKINADPTEEEIAQLQANLSRAEAALAEVMAGPTKEDVAQAEAAIRTAQAQLNELLADARDEDLKIAAAKVMQAQADVRKAQTEYDRVRYGDPPDRVVVGGELEKATLIYEAAQAELDKLINGATDEQIATARARVAEAQAALDKVQAGATDEQIAQAQAEVLRAEADLASLLAGATDEEIAIAEAQVETAQANLETIRANVEAAQVGVSSAQVQLEKTRLNAPFSGTVSSLNIDEGEIVQAGTNVIALGDTSKWQLETDDLTEIDVVDVQPGAKVSISVDALPDETLEGEVVKITPKSETKAGDVTYTVLIDITKGDTSRLRWGMTTFVDIDADSGIAR